ncbi:putative helicase C15C4.05 [Mycena kentingensis (nom. inval.)]|nr:putative helicase C15C4.05 [Mycena kentingensis (nom. inval.)]
MGKKKKSQLKPVERGFATTSVPKKVVVEEKIAEDTKSSDGASVEDVHEIILPPNAVPAPVTSSEEFDPDKVEEQSLQNLVDKQEKIEKEISRSSKWTGGWRKHSPRVQLDPVTTDRIIELALEFQVGDAKNGIEETEDKAIAKLATTYGVLRRIGFSEDRVVECLQAIKGVDLDEAYDWLYLHCADEEFEEQRATEAAEPRTPQNAPRAICP